jgi:4-amino-4-deoxy-L-arabinose transferase-like glycosyltransferase
MRAMTTAWRKRIPGLALALAVGLGLIPRVVLVWTGKLISDEAIVGLMGMEILKGRHFIFYMGQGYMGSLEAYLAAALFLVLGASAWVLKLSPLIFFILAAWATRRLAASLFDDLAGRIALAILFCSSWVFTLWSFAPRGGYMTTLALGGAALLVGSRMASPAGGSPRMHLLLGFLCGLGIWNHFLFIYYLAPLLLLVVAPGWRSPGRGVRLAAFAGGALAGLSPAIVWNIRHPWGSFGLSRMAGNLDIAANLKNLGLRQVPMLLGGNPALRREMLPPPFGWLLLALFAAATAWYGVRAWRRIADGSPDRWTTLLVPGVAATCLAAFLLTGFGSYNTQRYIIPAYPMMVVMLAVMAADIWKRRRVLGALTIALVVGINLWGTAVYVTRYGYPEGRRQQRDVGALLDHCRREGITSAWAGHWTCYLLTFLSRQELSVADAERHRYDPLQRRVAATPDASIITERGALEVEATLTDIGLAFDKWEGDAYTVFGRPHPAPTVGRPGAHVPASFSPPPAGFETLPEGGWRSTAPQTAGMSIELDLGGARRVGGVMLSSGVRTGETPKRFMVETSDDGIAWREAGRAGSYVGGLYWDERIRWSREALVTLLFTPREARRIRVTLTGPWVGHHWTVASASAVLAAD